MHTAVMGFGNPVRSDDGVGCYVIELLRQAFPGHEKISFLDMGTAAFEVLFQLNGHQRIIVVDAVVNSNEPDGTIFRLPASAIEAAIIDDPMVFLHSLKWDQALSYAKKILREDFPREEIYVYLIAITDIRMEVGLSQEVQQAAHKVRDHIIHHLADVI